jgi:actin-related protein 8|tara:strand:- start:271 stop:693 length:423 start_codon:yes stop_codon:yes gene_type:complete
LVGHDAVNLHKDDEYILRYPIKYGAFNVSSSYNINQCIDDLSMIITRTVEKEMKLPKANLKHFQCILVIPDSCVKIHVRYMINMLFDLGFKNMFIHQESVMATYAMALPTAVVVDIGSTKTSVCCIEEGIIIAKSVIRKN